jgi:hypothetical protein
MLRSVKRKRARDGRRGLRDGKARMVEVEVEVEVEGMWGREGSWRGFREIKRRKRSSEDLFLLVYKGG